MDTIRFFGYRYKVAIKGGGLLCKGLFRLSIGVTAIMSLAVSLIKFLRFLNKPSESLQKWAATPTDQILYKNNLVSSTKN